MSRNENAHAGPADGVDADRPYPHPSALGAESAPPNGEPPPVFYDAVHQEAKRLLASGPYLTFTALVELAGFGLHPVEETNVQIGAMVGRHPSTIRLHVRQIEAAGLIRREELKLFGCPRRIHFAYSHPGIRRGIPQRAPSPHKNDRHPTSKTIATPSRKHSPSPHESARPILLERLEEEREEYSTAPAPAISAENTDTAVREPERMSVGSSGPVETESERGARLNRDLDAMPAPERASLELKVQTKTPGSVRKPAMFRSLLLVELESSDPARYPKLVEPERPAAKPMAPAPPTTSDFILRVAEPGGVESVQHALRLVATELNDWQYAPRTERALRLAADGILPARAIDQCYRQAMKRPDADRGQAFGAALKQVFKAHGIGPVDRPGCEVASEKTARRVAVQSVPAGSSPMRSPLDNIIR
jgi:hypothetical protein